MPAPIRTRFGSPERTNQYGICGRKKFLVGGGEKILEHFFEFSEKSTSRAMEFRKLQFFSAYPREGTKPSNFSAGRPLWVQKWIYRELLKKNLFFQKKKCSSGIRLPKKSKIFIFLFFQVNRSDRVFVRKNSKRECICHVIVFVFGALGVRGPPSPKYKHAITCQMHHSKRQTYNSLIVKGGWVGSVNAPPQVMQGSPTRRVCTSTKYKYKKAKFQSIKQQQFFRKKVQKR